MPQTLHTERHFTSGAIVRDIVIGMSDGLTVPFALAAGLSGAVDSTAVIITAGLAEIAAGSLAMGLGGGPAAPRDARDLGRQTGGGRVGGKGTPPGAGAGRPRLGPRYALWP